MMVSACADDGQGKMLAVNVRGSVSVQPTEFSGHYLYENDLGVEVRRDIKGVGNFNEVVQGRHIKLVTLRRTSQQGVIGLVLSSDGKIIYDSGMLQTNELILYEAP